MSLVQVEKLRKRYPAFTLKGVSFSLDQGRITGLVGRNGAGKSTVLKAMLGLIHPDGGQAAFFGMPFLGNEREIKKRIGFVNGGVSFYPGKRLKTITEVTRGFYGQWDEAAYREYMEEFDLDDRKTPAQLSQGMRVKYALALALSHRAEILILDEPTTALDPVSREELLNIFLELAERGTTILFSTHITSDLDRCADDIIYIKDGEIACLGELEAFKAAWRGVAVSEENKDDERLIGLRREKRGYSALVRTEDAGAFEDAAAVTLEEIIVHLERQGERE